MTVIDDLALVVLNFPAIAPVDRRERFARAVLDHDRFNLYHVNAQFHQWLDARVTEWIFVVEQRWQHGPRPDNGRWAREHAAEWEMLTAEAARQAIISADNIERAAQLLASKPFRLLDGDHIFGRSAD